MGSNIIKDIVDFDQMAQEKINIIKKEEEHLNEFFKEYRDQFENEQLESIHKSITDLRKKLDFELILKREEVERAHEENKEFLESKFASNKETWIKEIFARLVK